MNILKIRKKYLKNVIIFIISLIFIFLISFSLIKKWHNKTVAKNSILCNTTARQLQYISKEAIEHFGNMSFFFSNNITFNRLMNIDTSLTNITEKVLIDHSGLEGGYYFSEFDKFVGYSYPTAEPPVPVYGPPPRSFNIIKEQCLKTINEGRSFTELHGFDPAIFPLVTTPVVYQDKVVGAIWVRIHIERELPLIKLQNVINVAVLLLIISLIIVLWVSYQLRMDIQSIRTDLEMVHQYPDFRLKNRGRLFTGIIDSINKTLERLHLENYQRRQLEYKLLQKEKMASIGRIVAGVAHEVRTPLAIIKTRIQMWQQHIKERTNNDIQTEFITEDSIKLVVNEADRLSNLIKRLLMFSKPINKKLSNVNMQDQLKEIIKFLQIQDEKPKINIEFAENEIPDIEVDVNLIQQVFINIISNSIEAMPEGGTIRINIKADDTWLTIEVDDQGVGIPDDIFDKVLELFVTSKPSGVGLGLSISNEIVKAHNGEIVFENLKQGGTRCTVKLPLKQGVIGKI